MHLLIFILASAAGAALVAVGYRGRRVGDHPVCVRCGFDLFGQPAGTAVCGECGCRVTSPGAIVIGHRRRRPRFMIAGSAILIPGLLIAGVMAWGQATSVNWMEYVPVPLLDRWAVSSNASTRTPALVELLARLSTKKLSVSQRDQLVKTGLAYQGDLSKPWDTGWGDILELAEANGQLSTLQWQQYATQASKSAIGVRLRPVVRIGDPLWYWTDSLGGRVARKSSLWIETRDVHIVWPGFPDRTKSPGGGGGSSLDSKGGSFGNELSAAEFPAGVKPGVIHVHVVANTSTGLLPSPAAWKVTPIVSGTLDLPATFTLLPADQSSVTIIHDASLADAIRGCITIRTFSGISVTVNGNPAGLAFDVFVKTDGVEHKIGSLACPAGTTNHSYSWGSAFTPSVGQTVDVLLRSNPAAAVTTTDTFQAWDGEIDFKDVLVK